MEYVAGLPLTKHCEQFALTMDQRLKVFLEVCSAVQHMHGRGIIHRDLKPSNVLVGEADGVPKVIDFGIAKSSDDPIATRSLATRVGSPIGTLEYMSPEQLHGRADEVDNRTDVYALGVILYEMLTGSRPFEVSRLSLPGAIKWILDHEPLRASTRVLRLGNERVPIVSYKELKGDLDWVLLKAIARDKNRRYSTVQELAADVQRFRDCEPVLARPDSVAYRARKFIARNPAVSILAAATVFALCAVTVLSLFAATISRKAEAAATAASRRNAQLAYRSSITAAAANAQRDPAAARRAVDEAPSELRDWEWHYLSSSIDQAPEFFNDGSHMSALAASADGRRIAIGFHDGRVLVWKQGDVSPRELVGHRRRIQSLKFGPDGTMLVSGGSDGGVRLWKVETRESMLLGTHSIGVPSVAFDGERVASGDASGLIRLWSLDARVLMDMKARSSVSSLALAGEKLVAGDSDGLVSVFDLGTGSVGAEWFAGRGVRALAITSQRTEVVTGTLTGVAARWELSTGKLVQRYTEDGHPGIRSIDLSPGDRLVAIGDTDGDITVLDRVTGERTGVLRGRSGAIEGVAFIGSASEIASASWNGAARGWTIGIGHAQRQFRTSTGRLARAWFDPVAGSVVALTDSGRLGRWNPETGETIESWELGGARALNVDPKAGLASFAADAGSVRIVDLARKAGVTSLPTKEQAIATAVAGASRLAAFGGESGAVEIWDFAGGLCRHAVKSDAGCTALEASADGAFFAAGFRNGKALLLDVRNRRVREVAFEWSSPVLAIAFSPDSSVAAFGVHENSVATLHFVRAETGEVIRSCGGGGAGIDTLAFSPSGRRVASSGERRSLRVWGVDDGQELLVLRDLDGPVTALAFSPDGLSLSAHTYNATTYVYSGSMPRWWWLQSSAGR